MKAYTYKDSGIEALGETPVHWKTKRLFNICDFIRGNSCFGKNDLLSEGKYVALQYGKTYKVESVNEQFNFYVNDEFYKSSQTVDYGDVIFVSTSETMEDLGHSVFYNRKDIGLVGGEQILLKPNKNVLDGKYLFYTSKVFGSELNKFATGIKVFRFDVYDLKTIYINLPPLNEQKIIAEYLDKATARIDSVLSIKRAQLQNLSLQKKSVIHEAVTGKSKLNINCETKDSGIEWLGEIPSHWTYDKLFRLCDNVGSGGTPQSTNQSYYDGDIFWVQSGDLTDGYVYDTKKKINELALQNSSAKVFPENTLLVAMYGATIGKVGIMTFEGAINQACCALDFSSKINPKFSYYLMLNARDYLITQAYGGGQQNISQETLKQLHLFYPSVEEQKSIADYLDTVLEKSLKLEEYIYSQIKILQNYRKSLIHECVTGKKQVADRVD